jgi:tRNA splicing ligase
LWILQMHNVQWQLGCLWLHVMVSKEYLDCAGWRWGQIGISAPQGCGKTTIVDSLEYLFNSLGRLVQNHFSHLQISCHFSNSLSKKAAQLMCRKLQSSSSTFFWL